MTAMSTNRGTKQHSGVEFQRLVLSGNQVYKGAAVGVNTAGSVQKMAKAVSGGLTCMGIAQQNVLGDGVKKVDIKSGCFQFFNSASTDAIANKDAGALCYFEDDQTVALTSTGSRAVAGRILGLADNSNPASQVIVEIGPHISFVDAT